MMVKNSNKEKQQEHGHFSESRSRFLRFLSSISRSLSTHMNRTHSTLYIHQSHFTLKTEKHSKTYDDYVPIRVHTSHVDVLVLFCFYKITQLVLARHQSSIVYIPKLYRIVHDRKKLKKITASWPRKTR